ncbi:putative cytochrome p450 [Trypoxylus dichotomus]
MFEYLFLTQLTLLLLALLAIVIFLATRRSNEAGNREEAGTGESLRKPPRPVRLPLIGHLHLLAGYEVPYQAFAVLRKKFGDVIELKLGNVRSLVVSGHKNIREILVTKGHHFDSRPNFERYRMLFSGDKENCYKIKKDTLIFLDNYDLSMSEEFWTEPHRFNPERFLVDNRFVKPEHFLPFGGGRRGCMGYKMVQLIGFGVLSTILQHFIILPANFESYKVPVGSLALPADTFSFNFVRRQIRSVI